MKITKNNIVGSCLITLDKFEDERGFFIESFNEQKFTKEIGFYEFVQDHTKNTLRLPYKNQKKYYGFHQVWHTDFII